MNARTSGKQKQHGKEQDRRNNQPRDSFSRPAYFQTRLTFKDSPTLLADIRKLGVALPQCTRATGLEKAAMFILADRRTCMNRFIAKVTGLEASKIATNHKKQPTAMARMDAATRLLWLTECA